MVISKGDNHFEEFNLKTKARLGTAMEYRAEIQGFKNLDHSNQPSPQEMTDLNGSIEEQWKGWDVNMERRTQVMGRWECRPYISFISAGDEGNIRFN